MFSKKSGLTIIFIIIILICFTTRPGSFAKSNDLDNNEEVRNDEDVCMEFKTTGGMPPRTISRKASRQH